MFKTIAPTASVDRQAHPTIGVKPLPAFRLNLMRLGYLTMGVGLMVFKWPILLSGSTAALPIFEGVVACLLTAMSLLALLGLRYPVAMLPVLLFECTWKVLWFAAFALPHILAGDMDTATTTMLFSCSFVVIIAAVTPWDYVWKRYATTRGEKWR